MDTDLLQRIRRVHTAVGTAKESDLNNLKASAISTDKIVGILQDFRGGLSDEELCNIAHSVIHNIANLRDHLRRWAHLNGRDKKKVDEAVEKSMELQIIMDLSNNDKHGYPPRNGGHSGKSPQLTEINRVMKLATRAQRSSSIGMTLGPGGVPRTFGDGTAKAVVTGQVVDQGNNPTGDLHDIATKAIEAWEGVLDEFGIGAVANGT